MGLTYGINNAKGCFGRVGHNGVALIGPLGATLSAAAFVCKIAEAALITQRCDKDAWANAFCLEVFPALQQSSAAAKSQGIAGRWRRDLFHFTGDASWNTPKKAK